MFKRAPSASPHVRAACQGAPMDPFRSRDTKSFILFVQGFDEEARPTRWWAVPGVLLTSREIQSVTAFVRRMSAKRIVAVAHLFEKVRKKLMYRHRNLEDDSVTTGLTFRLVKKHSGLIWSFLTRFGFRFNIHNGNSCGKPAYGNDSVGKNLCREGCSR